MTCEFLGNGMIVCRRGRRVVCSRPGCNRAALYECDFSVATRKSGTCDARICERHAKVVGDDRHYCVPHASAPEPRRAPKQLPLL